MRAEYQPLCLPICVYFKRCMIMKVHAQDFCLLVCFFSFLLFLFVVVVVFLLRVCLGGVHNFVRGTPFLENSYFIYAANGVTKLGA